MTSCQVVPYEDRLRGQVVQLRAILNPGFSAEEFAWRYERNPYLAKPHIAVALDGERVVGMRSCQGARWEAGPRHRGFDAPCMAGTILEPAYRAKGLFARLDLVLEEMLETDGIRYVLNFSAMPATQLGSLARGWRGVGPLRTSRRTGWGAGRPGQLGRAQRVTQRLVGSLRLRFSSASVRSDLDPSEMEALVAEVGSEGRIRHVRDATYFRWRFRNPSAVYRFVTLRRSGGLVGFLALREPKIGRRLDVVEWQALEPDVLEEMLLAAMRYAESRSKPLCVWPASLPEPAQPWLAARDFADLPEPVSLRGWVPSLLVKHLGSLDPSAEWAVDGVAVDRFESWDLRMAYRDGL